MAGLYSLVTLQASFTFTNDMLRFSINSLGQLLKFQFKSHQNQLNPARQLIKSSVTVVRMRFFGLIVSPDFSNQIQCHNQ